MALRLASKRLAKELKELTEHPPEGIQLIDANDLRQWTVGIEVLGESVYQGEKFALEFKFDDRYPIEVPQVTFVTSNGYQAPVHPHVYSNGHICASILASGWSPVLNVSAVCITMQSMLASCKKKERPEGHDSYVQRAPSNPKLTRWAFHDDNV